MEELQLVCENDDRVRKIMNYEEHITFGEDFKYILFVDDVPVVKYNLILQKYNGKAIGVYCAEIQYENYFIDGSEEEKEKYVGKGYVQRGLRMLIDLAMNYNIPFVHLDINENNIASNMVAERCGLIKQGQVYYEVHPNARELISRSVSNNPNQDQIMEKVDVFLDSINISNKKIS